MLFNMIRKLQWRYENLRDYLLLGPGFDAYPWHSNLPHPLAKAIEDPAFNYLVVLRNGTAIECEGITEGRRGWVCLLSPHKPDKDRGLLWGCCFERGLEVRVSDIMACADAPHGS